jgi:hypothetical protein
MIGRIRFDFDVRNTKEKKRCNNLEKRDQRSSKAFWEIDRIMEDDGKFRRRVEKDRK